MRAERDGRQAVAVGRQDELLGDGLGLGVGGLEAGGVGGRLVGAGEVAAVEDDAGRAGVDQPRNPGRQASVDDVAGAPDVRAAVLGLGPPQAGLCGGVEDSAAAGDRAGDGRRVGDVALDLVDTQLVELRVTIPREAPHGQAPRRSSRTIPEPRNPPPPVTSTGPRSAVVTVTRPSCSPRPRASRGRSSSCGGCPPGMTGGRGSSGFAWCAGTRRALEQLVEDPVFLAPREPPRRLDADHGDGLPADLDAHQRRAEHVGMSVEDRLAGDGVERLVGQDDPVRLPPAEPDPPAIVEIADVAHPVTGRLPADRRSWRVGSPRAGWKYSRVTTGPETTISPIVPAGSRAVVGPLGDRVVGDADDPDLDPGDRAADADALAPVGGVAGLAEDLVAADRRRPAGPRSPRRPCEPARAARAGRPSAR